MYCIHLTILYAGILFLLFKPSKTYLQIFPATKPYSRESCVVPRQKITKMHWCLLLMITDWPISTPPYLTYNPISQILIYVLLHKEGEEVCQLLIFTDFYFSS